MVIPVIINIYDVCQNISYSNYIINNIVMTNNYDY